MKKMTLTLLKLWLPCTLLWLLSSPLLAAPLQQFELVKLQLGDEKIISVQLADTGAKRMQGLMFQQSADPGMLLLYATPQPMSLWMKNTTMPLDVAFIDPQWRISGISALQPLDETGVSSPGKVIAALEMPQGWFAEQGIKVGTKVKLTGE